MNRLTRRIQVRQDAMVIVGVPFRTEGNPETFVCGHRHDSEIIFGSGKKKPKRKPGESSIGEVKVTMRTNGVLQNSNVCSVDNTSRHVNSDGFLELDERALQKTVLVLAHIPRATSVNDEVLRANLGVVELDNLTILREHRDEAITIGEMIVAFVIRIVIVVIVDVIETFFNLLVGERLSVISK